MSQKIQFARKSAVVANYAAALAAARGQKPLYGEPVVIKYTSGSETLLALFIGIDGAGLVHEVGSFTDITDLNTQVDILFNKLGEIDRLTTTNKDNLVAAINEVNEGLAQAVAGGITSVVAGAGVEVDSTNGHAPKVSAKVATSETGNILVVDEAKGLYATIDFAYDAVSQKLTLTGSNGFSKAIDLAIPAVVKAGSYDAANNEIVLTFTDNSTVKIPAKNLIDEWKVASTATLELIRDAAEEGNIDYVLKGNVKISAESGNTLIAKNDGLYVAATDLSGLTDRIVALEDTVGDSTKGLVKAVAENAAAAAAAQDAADAAQETADNAYANAGTASEKARTAQETADNAATAAATADTKAVNAQSSADTAQETAEAAAAAASTADGKAAAAQSTANTALEIASEVEETAFTAQQLAKAVKDIADANTETLETIKVKDVDGTTLVKDENGNISVNVIDGGEF